MTRWFIVLVAGLFCSFTVHGATRVALVTTGADAELDKVQDTALALLGKDAGLEMVERAEINRVLQEQQQSLGGIVGGNEAVKAGQLLHADLFAVLEGAVITNARHTKPLALIVFNARTGVRYADSVLAATNAASAASATADTLRTAVAKSHQSTNDLHTVCLLVVRNADLPAADDRFCDSVGPLLERELTGLPGIAVLERTRLAHVSAEQQLAPEENQLLSSLQLVELDVSRDGDGVKGTLGVVSTEGARTNGAAAVVSTSDAEALAHALGKSAGSFLTKNHTTANFGPEQRLAEAQRFHEEMERFQAQGVYLPAMRAMEAAYALAPNEPDYGVDMVVCLCDGATEYFAPGTQRGKPVGLLKQEGKFPEGFQPDMRMALLLGNRAADLLAEMCQQAMATLKPGDPVPPYLRGAGINQVTGMLKGMAQLDNLDDSAQAGLMALRQKKQSLETDVFGSFWPDRSEYLAQISPYNQPARSAPEPTNGSGGRSWPKTTTAWTNASCLLDFSQPVNGFHWLLRPVAQDGVMYGAALGIKEFGLPDDTLQLVRIPLGDGRQEYLSHTGPADLAGLMSPNRWEARDRYWTNAKVPGVPLRASSACIGAGRYFLGTASHGVYIFPLAGGLAGRFCTTNGLPSDQVTALAFLDGKLYITATGESFGYLLSYDLNSRKMETLASSRRSEHLSPFDDQPAFDPFFLEADPARHRLILGVSEGLITSDGPLLSFWSIISATRQFKRCDTVTLESPTSLSQDDWAGKLDANTVGALRCSNTVEDTIGLKYRFFRVYSVPSAGTNRTLWRTAATSGAVPPLGLHPVVSPPQHALLVDGWLWNDRGVFRISLNTAKSERLPPLTSNREFRPSQCLQLLDDGKRMLVGDDYGLWLLSQPSEPVKNETRRSGDNGP